VVPVVVRVVAPGGTRVVLRGLLALLVLLLVVLLLVVLLLVVLLLAHFLLEGLPVGASWWGRLHFPMLGSWCLLGRVSASE
jgi:hypothetical protein